MSSLFLISSLSISLRQPGPKVLSLPGGPACQLHLLPLALPRRLAPFLPPNRREPAPTLLPSLPGARPPGAHARAPPLPSRSMAEAQLLPSIPSVRPSGGPLLRGLHARGCRVRRVPARLGMQDEAAGAALLQASSAGAATPTGSPAAVDAPHPAIPPPIQALGKVPCKFLLLPSSSTSPSPPALETAARRRGWAARAPTSCSGLLRLRQRAPQVRRTLGSLNLVASPPGARRRRACRRNRTIFCPLLLLLRREVEEGGRGNNDISPRPADWTPTCHACVACHMRKCGKIIS